MTEAHNPIVSVIFNRVQWIRKQQKKENTNKNRFQWTIEEWLCKKISLKLPQAKKKRCHWELHEEWKTETEHKVWHSFGVKIKKDGREKKMVDWKDELNFKISSSRETNRVVNIYFAFGMLLFQLKRNSNDFREYFPFQTNIWKHYCGRLQLRVKKKPTNGREFS